ncbi:MAG: phosphotransferase [Anaerolineae bacterium]|nr:phosphotransferase [Anaerolineae bacterium]
MSQPAGPPSRETVRALLDVLIPEHTAFAIHALPGSYSNVTHLVQVRSGGGTDTQIVVRRYIECSAGQAEKARLEFRTLALLRNHSIPVPEPLYLDEAGALLGTPGIVTRYVPGTQVMSPLDPQAWARTLATMLAKIHSVPCDAAARQFLLDANIEATWFLHAGAVPDYMRAHPDGATVWQAIHDRFPGIQEVKPALVHIDYWPGNVLWEGEQITAVVDWEEAAYGDTGIDVAYCRMNMFLDGLDQAAGEFLSAYEAERGPVANLAFWELAAAARPMIDPEGWEITEPAKGNRFRQFIRHAKQGWFDRDGS